MIIKQKILKLAIGIAMLSVLTSGAYAHGWSEFPNARQNICFEQGGIWSGTPPNAGCANAKKISDTYPFVQRNEYSINISDYRDMNAVKAAIPDGTLCYANDSQKKGMGAPSTAWTRTEIKSGTFEYVFNATAPHSPSYWQFYLTKADADLSKALAWDDLELLQTNENIPVIGGKYKTNVTIPSNRSGDAILFVRWQRDDAAGEGFYNCSDITITGGGTTQPDLNPGENLQRGDLFVSSYIDIPKIGDTVKYDILNVDGNITRTFDIKIDATNTNDWARLLASKINGWYAKFENSNVFIGDWHEEMNHYMYFRNDSSLNYINSKDSSASGVMTVVKGNSSNVDSLTNEIYELVKSDKRINAGDKIVLITNKAVTLTQTQGTQVQIENNGTSSMTIHTNALEKNETLMFSASTSGKPLETFTFDVIVNNGAIIPPNPKPEPNSGDTWNSSKIYTDGDIVIYNKKQWKAQWWIKGGTNPELTYSNNVWGVWRPVTP